MCARVSKVVCQLHVGLGCADHHVKRDSKPRTYMCYAVRQCCRAQFGCFYMTKLPQDEQQDNRGAPQMGGTRRGQSFGVQCSRHELAAQLMVQCERMLHVDTSLH